MISELITRATIAIALCGAATQVSAQQSFTFSGNISGAPAGARIFLDYPKDGKMKRDSCMLNNGAFIMKGDIANPELVFLRVFTGPYKIISDEAPNAKEFFLEPGNISLNGSYDQFKSAKIAGSAADVEFQAMEHLFDVYNAGTATLFSQLKDMSKQRSDIKKQNADDPRITKLDVSIDSVREKILSGYEKIYKSHIAAHPKSFVSTWILTLNKSSWKLSDVKAHYLAFTPAMQQSEYGRGIKKYLDTKDDTAPGHPAKDFTTATLDGKSISLSAFKGKYVILDFWASWCVPCRASTPHLIDLYHKYHSKGLEVIAVADNDGDEKNWKDAVKKDKSDLWVNVLRGLKQKEQDHSNDISDKFGISLLPTKVLIDKDGIIIGQYVGTEEAAALDKKLTEVFN